jgi:hypothetical protein
MFDKIGKSKDRRTLLKLVKEHFPDTVIPEIDASAPYEDRLTKIEAQLADREREKAEEGAKRTIAAERRKLREQGWDDEGIEKIEARMRETENPDYESAAAWAEKQLPKDKPLPTTFATQRYNWFTPPEKDDGTELLMKNPRSFQDREIAKFLAEQRGRKAGQWGNQ